MTERKELCIREREIVRAEYRVLLVFEAKIELPWADERMKALLESLVKRARDWAIEEEGKKALAEFTALESKRLKATFPCRSFLLTSEWEETDGILSVFLEGIWRCGSEIRITKSESLHFDEKNGKIRRIKSKN